MSTQKCVQIGARVGSRAHFFAKKKHKTRMKKSIEKNRRSFVILFISRCAYSMRSNAKICDDRCFYSYRTFLIQKVVLIAISQIYFFSTDFIFLFENILRNVYKINKKYCTFYTLAHCRVCKSHDRRRTRVRETATDGNVRIERERIAQH